MRLTSVTVEGFRSVRDRQSIPFDDRVTVILGPNDHGKSNILLALTRLNDDGEFQQDDDLNWDRVGGHDDLPFVAGTFLLDSGDLEEIRAVVNAHRTAANRQRREQAAAHPDNSEAGGEPDAKPTPDELPLEIKDLQEAVTLSRRGLDGGLQCGYPDYGAGTAVEEIILDKLAPRFELLAPWAQIEDEATANGIKQGQNDFMRGILYYAGLDPDDAGLFTMSDRTSKKLRDATDVLNRDLREHWSQGRELKFQLAHDSKNNSITLRIEDPNVEDRYVRASRRSAGFTQYFSLKTVLHARAEDARRASFFWLFDEPGTFLHPSAQHDLLRVLEVLADQNQLAYSTYSLFMLNKNFPQRHRMIAKRGGGTAIDCKPYRNRWRTALETLGMGLGGTILFAKNVLLVEGEADAIYVSGVLQKLVATGGSTIDLNQLAVIPVGSSHQDLRATVRLLTQTEVQPKFLMLLDGDEGGRDHKKALKPFLDKYPIDILDLPKGTEIEDCLPLQRELLPQAVATVLVQRADDLGNAKPDATDLASQLSTRFDNQFPEKKEPAKVWGWVVREWQSAGAEGKPAKIAVAREYVRLLLDLPAGEFSLRNSGRLKRFLSWLEGVDELVRVRAAGEVLRQPDDG